MKKEAKTSWTPALLLGSAVVLIWFVSPSLMSWLTGKTAFSELGPVGDAFGAVNSLFSGLAFVGLFYAILLQRTELELQRKELADTREVLASQRVEAEKQNATLSKQSFETAFFQLLKLNGDIVNAIDIRKTGDSTQILDAGKGAFKRLYSIFYDNADRVVSQMPSVTVEDLRQRAISGYDFFYQHYKGDMGHYFRSLYNIIKFVDRSNLTGAEKKFYTNIVRSQLSNYEILLLFYNCVSPLGQEKFKPLVEKYALLKQIDLKELINRERDLALYKPSAFGDQV